MRAASRSGGLLGTPRRRNTPGGPSVAARASVLALALWLVWAPLVAAQAALQHRHVGVRWANGVPLVSVSVEDLAADARVRRSLESGLRKNIVITAQAFLDGSDRLIAARELTCSITYDLWEETYVLRAGRTSAVYRSLAGALDACLDLRQVQIGQPSDYAAYSGQRIYFAIRAEFNPITRSRCRRLLGNAGSDDPIGPVVVNIVRREICQAERAIEFRSQTETVP